VGPGSARLSVSGTVELQGITWDHERGRDPLLATAERFEKETGIRVSWTARSLQAFADAPIPVLAERYDLLVLTILTSARSSRPERSYPDELLDGEFIADRALGSVGRVMRATSGRPPLGLATDAAGRERLPTRPPEAPTQHRCGPERRSRAGSQGRAAGMTISLPNKPVDTLGSLLTLLANGGADPYTDEEQVAPREVALEKLELLVRLTEASPPDAFSWNPILLLEHMAEHDDVVYCPMLFGYSNYSRPGFRRNLVRFSPVPSAGLGPRGGIIGGAGLSISSRCEHLDAARAYAEYVGSPEVQRTLYVEAGGQPGHRSAWHDQHANELAASYFADTLPGLDAGYLRPRYDGALLVQNEGGNMVWESLRSGGDPSELLDRLDAVYRRSLADHAG
jgi:multiple sugar transport system substrate-binding protein